MRTALLAALLAVVAPAQAELHAVLIGIDKYDSEDVTALRYTVNDVTAFRDLLVDPAVGGAKPENVVLLTPQSDGALRPTRTGIMVQIKKAALRTQPDDTLIFYFAGHGMQTAEGQFLLGVDADPLLLADTAVPLERLPDILKDVRAKQIVAIIDACRNDPNAGRAQADNPLTEAFARGLRPRVVTPGGGAPKKIATWLACAVGERAWEITDRQHGVFSHFLLEGLKGQAAAGGQVSLSGLADYVTKQVAAWARQAGKQQTPRLDNPDGVSLVMSRPRPTQPRPQTVPTKVKVRSTPAGATVKIDGEPKGVTPCEVSLPLKAGETREVQISLELEGYQPAARTEALEAGNGLIWEKELTAAAPLRTEPLKIPDTKSPQPPPGHDTPGTKTSGPGLGTLPTGSSTTVVVTGGPGGQENWRKDWVPGPDGQPMVEVPSGSFTMGSPKGADSTESPQHEVGLETYQIHAREVNCEAYSMFLNMMQGMGVVRVNNEGNVETAASEHIEGMQAGIVLLWMSTRQCGVEYLPAEQEFRPKPGRAEHPVAPVTWFGAWLYASIYRMALPTEAQWERAALGSDENWRFPYGPRLEPKITNVGNEQGDTWPGGAAGGASAVGCLEMVGNVWEWTADVYLADYHRRGLKYEPVVSMESVEGATHLTVRGGGYTWPADMASNRVRRGVEPFALEPDLGFRCVFKAASHTDDEPATPKPATGGPNPGANAAQSDLFTLEPHELTKAQLAVPRGWESVELGDDGLLLLLPEGVDVEDEDARQGLFYFPIGANYTNSADVHTALMVELDGLGFEAQNVTQDGPFDVGNTAFQVHRRILGGLMDDEPAGLIIDVLRYNNRYFAFVMACAPELWKQTYEAYWVLLTNTRFP
ncbi:MAG: SUMF1/EgtB/PvdO family nonheme iron enzyme [Fimbriimonadaceae bacterium]|nr:SUMF1/EgtB/PvdO family nonheme iron enzyme [Fimbriimonadaceae bacterium]